MTLGLHIAVIFENFRNSTCFSIFFYRPKQLNKNKLWYLPKCVPFVLFNYSSLSYDVLALSYAVTNLPNKTFKDRKLNSMTFQALKLKLLNSMTFQVFHDLYEPSYNPANGLTFT